MTQWLGLNYFIFFVLGIPFMQGCRFIDSGENKDDGRPE